MVALSVFLAENGDDSKVEGEISVVVHPFVGLPFNLEGRKFSSSDTFAHIRKAIGQEIWKAIDQAVSDNRYELNNPETVILQMRSHCCGHNLEDEWTIQSLFSSACPKTISIALFPRSMMRCPQLPLPETMPPDLSTVDHPETFVRRPKAQTLPFRDASSLLIFDGPLVLKNRRGNDLSIDKIIDCFNLSTSASHILLAPTFRIWSILSALNGDSRYLVVRVTWDRLSYLFIRLIYKFYPQIPFVAVTDLDPHQLDLLAFLDTDQSDLIDFYGWDMIDEVYDYYLADVESVDIKWLGLRPSDLDLCPDFFDSLALPFPGDFDNILSRIEWNPNLSRWAEELILFKEHRKCVRFQPIGPLKDVVSKRLLEKNWV